MVTCTSTDHNVPSQFTPKKVGDSENWCRQTVVFKSVKIHQAICEWNTVEQLDFVLIILSNFL